MFVQTQWEKALYFECRINKNALLQTVFFLAILPTGKVKLSFVLWLQESLLSGNTCKNNTIWLIILAFLVDFADSTQLFLET